MVLSETGPEHLHVIAEEVSRVAELCIGQGNLTGFRDWAVVRLPSLLRRVLSIRRVLPCDGRCQGKVVEHKAKCYACLTLSLFP